MESTLRMPFARRQAWRPDRVLFIAAVAWGAALFWMAPYPPMIDLPQHAGQVVVLHDLLLGRSPWADLVRINLLTPYLIGYGLTLALSFVMPVVVALKLLLSAAFCGFVAGCVLLRRSFGGDPRLDWLFIPGFFGMAYYWGFFTYLITVPLGVLFLVLAHRYAESPQPRTGWLIFAAGVGLFFSHGLVFLMATCAGGAVLLVRHRRLERIVRLALPYLALAALFAVFFVINRKLEKPVGPPDEMDQMFYWGLNKARVAGFLAYIFGGDKADVVYAPLALAMFAAPFLIGARFNGQVPYSWVPFAVILAIWTLVPQYALKTGLMYERFACFILPFYALLFRPPRAGERTPAAATSRTGQWLLAGACLCTLLIQSIRTIGFGRESADFTEVLKATQPGQRALYLILDQSSRAARDAHLYRHYAAWYQAEKDGWVDFNFALFTPQIVRYRDDRLPAVRHGFEWAPEQFRWSKYEGWLYRYIFVRRTGPLPAELLANDPCRLTLLKSEGTWSVYEQTDCRPASGADR